MEFTNEEKERINQLYGNDFKDIKPEDAQLIARWESWKATQEDEHRAKIEALEAESAARLEAITNEANYSMETLRELHDLAVARYKGVDDGKTQQK